MSQMSNAQGSGFVRDMILRQVFGLEVLLMAQGKSDDETQGKRCASIEVK